MHDAARGTGKWEKLTGAVVEIDIEPDGEPDHFCPIKLVVRGADQYKARIALEGALKVIRAKYADGSDDSKAQAALEEELARQLHVPKVRVVMCLNLAFNDFFRKARFRYFDVEDVVPLLKVGDWMAVVDLAAYFLTLPLHRKHHKNLNFKCPKTGKWKCLGRLPFGAGLSPVFASFYSSEIVDCVKGKAAELLRKWRKTPRRKRRAPDARIRWCMRAVVSVFVDDLITAGSTEEECKEGVLVIKAVLAELGFEAAKDKLSESVPCQTKKYLGRRICTTHKVGKNRYVQISLDKDKRDFLVEQLEQIVAAGTISYSELESVVGSLSFVATVLRGSRARIAALHELKRRRKLWGHHARHSKSWKAEVQLISEEALADLKWWLGHLNNGSWPASVVLDTDRPMAIIYMKSDASGVDGWGYHTLDETTEVKHDQGRFAAGKLKDWPILALELYPLVAAVKAHGAEWRHRTLVCGIDNAGLAMSVNAQRGKDEHTRKLMRELADLMIKYDLIILARWCERGENTVADDLSKSYSYEDAMARAAKSARGG